MSPGERRITEVLPERLHGLDTRLYGLDIETDTAAGGLDPGVAAIVAVAVSTGTGDVVFDGDESTLLGALEGHLGSLEPGVIVTWNGSSFDLPFLADRAALHGIALGLRLEADPTVGARSPLPGHDGGYRASWGEHGHLDGYRLYRADVGRTLGISCGLKPLAGLVGLETVHVERTRIHELSTAELHRYVASDARLARQLVMRRLPHALAAIDRVTGR